MRYSVACAWRFILILNVLALAGCGSTLTVPTAPTVLSEEPTPTQAPPALSLADDGRTIHLTVGEHFELNLGDDHTWTVTIEDQRIVSRLPLASNNPGSQGLYEARESGRTTLSATGDPLCRQQKPPCASPSRLFRVEIIVQ